MIANFPDQLRILIAKLPGQRMQQLQLASDLTGVAVRTLTTWEKGQPVPSHAEQCGVLWILAAESNTDLSTLSTEAEIIPPSEESIP